MSSSCSFARLTNQLTLSCLCLRRACQPAAGRLLSCCDLKGQSWSHPVCEWTAAEAALQAAAGRSGGGASPECDWSTALPLTSWITEKNQGLRLFGKTLRKLQLKIQLKHVSNTNTSFSLIAPNSKHNACLSMKFLVNQWTDLNKTKTIINSWCQSISKSASQLTNKSFINSLLSFYCSFQYSLSSKLKWNVVLTL